MRSLSAQQTYRPDLDGLRALAVVAVLIFHAFPQALPGGFVGVDVFFVISGFLIARIIDVQMAADCFSYSEFYGRRIRRLFPALALVVTAVLVFGYLVLFPEEYAELGSDVVAGVAFLGNFAAWKETGYFAPSAELKPLLHLWSLGIEEQFYFLLPPLLALAYRSRAGRLKIPFVLALVGLSFAANLLLLKFGKYSNAFYLPTARLWEIGMGALLALWPRQALPLSVRHALSIGGTGLLTVSMVCINGRMDFPGLIALAPTLGATALLAAGPEALINRTLLTLTPMTMVGRISYPLYLWHWPLLALALLVTGEPLRPLVKIELLMAAGALSMATYLFLEIPIRERCNTKRVWRLLWPMAALAAIGGAIDRSDGFRFRYTDPRVVQIIQTSQTKGSDGTCKRFLGDQSDRLSSICQTNGSNPTMLILGDSHAMALNSAAQAGDFQLKSMLLAANGCLPFQNGLTTHYLNEKLQPRLECAAVATDALFALEQIASLKAVVVATRGPFYFSGVEFSHEGKPQMTIGRLGEVVDAPSAFVDGYRDLLRSLIKSGKSIFFALDNPELNFDPRRCIKRRLFGFALPSCEVSRAQVDERQRAYRALIKQILFDLPSVRLIDLTPAFCDESVCRVQIAGDLLYFDRDHLNLKGSRLALEVVKRAVESH